MSLLNGAPINSLPINAEPVSNGNVSGWDIGDIDGPAVPPFAAQAGSWSLTVTVDSIDISATLVDLAPVTVEAERNAARIAEFTSYWAGSIDPNAWVGRVVTIDVTVGAVQTRLFSGVIAEPELDLATLTLRCRCTDDLQRVTDGMTHDDLLTLTGAYWSDDVFDREASGWERLQDMLTAAPRAVWLSTAGVLVADSLFPRATAHGNITDALILDDSLRVTLAQRANLINRVDVTLNARFERLYHRVETLEWTWPLSFCETFAYGLPHMIKQVARDAIEDAGWRLVGESYDPLWSTGVYNCDSGPVIFNNISPDELITGFEIAAAKRWAQSITDSFRVSVTAPASIAVYGELSQSLSGSADFASAEVDTWGNDETDYAVLPIGFATDGTGNRYRDDIDTTRLQTALDCVIAQAVQRINTSHLGTRIECDLPIQPAIDLAHTLAVNTATLAATGVMQRFRHSFDLATARAVTSVELAVASGQSGATQPAQQWETPRHPAPTPGTLPTPLTVPNHIGRSWNTVPFDESLWGWFVNRATPELIAGSPPDPVIAYEDEQLIIEIPAVADDYTQHRTDTVSASIEIAVPHNSMGISA